MKLYPALVLLAILALSILPVNGQGPSLASGGMTVIGHYEGRVHTVFVQDNYAYLGQETGLIALNTATAPLAAVGQVELPTPAQAICVSGNYAYIAAGGLRVVDVSEPAAPVEVGFYDTPGEALDVYVSDGIAYVADGMSGLRVLDVNDPLNPVELAYFRNHWWTPVIAVYVSDNMVYLAGHDIAHDWPWPWWGRFWILDASDPANLVHVAQYNISNYTNDVYVSGNIAYIALDTPGTGAEGISIVGLGPPLAPFGPLELGFYESVAKAVHVSGNFAYIAAGSAGLRVLDVSDPTHPIEGGFYDTPGDAQDVFVSKGLIYVADGEGGLFVLRYAPYQVYLPFLSR